MTAIKADASPEYRAVHDSGPRVASNIKWIVVHSTEGGGAAQWFANPASAGSANMVVTDDQAYRTLPDLVVPWAAPPLNTTGWHIEFEGYARWSQSQWLAHDPMLHRGAYKVALRCKRYGIPARWVGGLGLRLGRKGLTTHKVISDTYHQSDHQDPGPGFPRAYFLKLVKGYLKAL